MNTTEELLRAAMHETATEVAPGTIAPLSLPAPHGPGRRRPRRVRPRARTRPAGWRRAVAPLTAAAAVITVIFVTVALVGPGSAGHHPGAGHPVAGHRGHRHGAGQSARLDQEVLDSAVPATGAQYGAGARLQTLQSTIAAACTAQAGLPIPHFQKWAASYAQIFFDNSQFPDLTRISRAGTLGGGAVGPLPRSAGVSRRVLDTTFNHCQAAVRRAFKPVGNAAQKLAGPWLAIITRIQASAPVRATLPGLRSCAARYGWPAEPYGAPDSTIRSFGDFTNWVAAYLDGAGSRGLSSAKLQRHWAHVFVTCGRPAIAVQERLQSARRAVFLRGHARPVRVLETLASRVVARLDRKYGVSGTG